MDVISNNPRTSAPTALSVSAPCFRICSIRTCAPGAQATEQNTLPSGLQLGTGVRPVSTQRIHTQGVPNMTGDEYDVAIEGKAFSGADAGRQHGVYP